MNKIIIIALLSAAISVQNFSQSFESGIVQGTICSLGLNIGVNDFHFRDKYMTPYIFSGMIFSSGIQFKVSTENNRHIIRLLFSTGGISSDKQNRDVNPYIGNISYHFIHSIDHLPVFGKPLRFFLGAGISLFGNYTSFDANGQTAGSVSYDDTWYINESLNFCPAVEYVVGRGESITISFTLPVAGFIRRPENGHYFSSKNQEVIDNKLKVFTGGRLNFFWQNFALLSEAEYIFQVNNKIRLHGNYYFGYSGSDNPAESLSTGMYMNNFLVGADWIL